MNPRTELLIHPQLARKVADFVTHAVYDLGRYNQVYPGIFAEPSGTKSLVVVIGAAPISHPATNALRKCGYLDQIIGLQNPEARPEFVGPKSIMGDDEWSTAIVESLSKTRDVNCVMSIFEVMVATSPIALANLASASSLIAAHMPFDLDPVNNEPFLIDLGRELDLAVDEAGAA